MNLPLIDSLTSGLFESWLVDARTNVSRYVVFALGTWIILWVLLAPALKGRKIRPASPPARQMVIEFLCSIRSIVVFSTIGLLMTPLGRAGLMPGPDIAASWGPVWFWISLALMIIGHDAWFYWTHRLVHHPKLFRAFHRRHHRSHNPSPFAAYSFDVLEAAIIILFVPVWMLILPTTWEAAGLFVLHQIVRNTIGHAGYELFPSDRYGRPLFGWLTTVTHHDLHHAQAGWNYGLYFTFWDRVMGTEHPAYVEAFANAVRRRPEFGATLPDPDARALGAGPGDAVGELRD